MQQTATVRNEYVGFWNEVLVYREAGALADAQHEAIAAALKAELARHETAEGIVMQSSSWKVTARNPG